MTGVEDHTVTDYARVLAKADFCVLTFDAGYQGEGSCEPRGLEDPHQRVEDNKAAISFLTIHLITSSTRLCFFSPLLPL